MNKTNIAFIFGTRPEGIKLAPVIMKYKKDSRFQVTVINSGQHQELLDEVLSIFKIVPDYTLKVMSAGQSLASLTSKLMTQLDEVLLNLHPDLVFVQGDTTTAMVGAMCAFYHKIPIAHIEAGLRSNNLYAPWPEEANRKVISSLATCHFTPTKIATGNLLKEGILSSNIYEVGNTIVDALSLVKEKVPNQEDCQKLFPLGVGQKALLVTVYRRENFEKLPAIYRHLLELSRSGEYRLFYLLHPNPEVKNYAKSYFACHQEANITLLEPLPYTHFIGLLNKAALVITDSGGVQEEATALKKNVFILRDGTERMESVNLGYSKLVGGDGVDLLDAFKAIGQMKPILENPYGDGLASERIRQIVGTRGFA